MDVFNGKQYVNAADFNTETRPNFFGDPRINRVHVYPKNDSDHTWMSPQMAATASSHGGSCCSCLFTEPGKRHSINEKPRLFLMGDELSPLLAGSGGECASVFRIESGSFQQLQTFVEHQISAGLRPKKGSVAVVFLMAHLRRVGWAEWWADFQCFSKFAAKHNLLVLPALNPFPEGYELGDVIHILQLFKRLQFEHFGRTGQPKQKNFSLWRILDVLSANHCARVINVSAPHIKVAVGENAFSSIKVSSMFIPGFSGDWVNGMPPQIEQDFLLALFHEIENVVRSAAMPLAAVNIPPAKSVAMGMKTTADKVLPHAGKQVVLIGGSNLKRIGAELEKELAPLGAQMISFCKGVDHRALFGMFEPQHIEYLKNCGETDVMVLHFFGNSMLTIDSHYPETLPPLEPTLPPRHIRHVVNPRILSDVAMDTLLSDAQEVITWAVDNFKGKILLAGPMPRYITPCCAENTHVIKDAYNQPVDMVKYTNAMSQHLKNSLDIPNRVEFVDYRHTIKAGDCDKNMCPDRVHVSPNHQKKIVSFIVNSLAKPICPPPQKPHYTATFSDALMKFHVFSKKVVTPTTVKQELDEEAPLTIDDAINLACPPTPAPPSDQTVLTVQTYLSQRYGINSPP